MTNLCRTTDVSGNAVSLGLGGGVNGALVKIGLFGALLLWFCFVLCFSDVLGEACLGFLLAGAVPDPRTCSCVDVAAHHFPGL